jgi:hypothetical protein
MPNGSDAFFAEGGSAEYDFLASPGPSRRLSMATLLGPRAIIPASRLAARSTAFITALSAPAATPGEQRPVRSSISISSYAGVLNGR